jgi:hypothetical protein
VLHRPAKGPDACITSRAAPERARPGKRAPNFGRPLGIAAELQRRESGEPPAEPTHRGACVRHFTVSTASVAYEGANGKIALLTIFPWAPGNWCDATSRSRSFNTPEAP